MTSENRDNRPISEVKAEIRARLSRSRKERQDMRREMRRQRKANRPPVNALFWGLMLILWAILIFLYGQHRIVAGDLWKAFLIGLGTIFIIQAMFYLFNPQFRPHTVGRLVPGVILVFVGAWILFGLSSWWPLVLVIVGVAVIVISWSLQREIVRRHETQETLRESEVKYRHIVDNANSIIMEIDTAGNITFMNDFGLKFFGFEENEVLGRNVVGTIIDVSSPVASRLDSITKGTVAAPDEQENLRRNGEKVWVVWTYKPILDEAHNLIEILCTGIDRTEQKKAEELAARQIKEQTATEERSRLARDLHDAVSQTLFSTSLIAEVLPMVWEKNHDEGLKKLEEVRQLTRGALAEMRTLLFELRPAALADADLNDLLRQLAESVIGRARVPVALKINGECEIPVDVKIALYRIAQEALNNIAKHSGAGQAQVFLECRPHSVDLSIFDNGRGFDVSRETTGSFGLSNMKERAGQIGASFRVESRAGEGTKITVAWRDGAGEAEQ